MAQFVVKVELDKEQFQKMIDDFKAENPDFIEVVRCKDCIHHNKDEDLGKIYCISRFGGWVCGDFFCADGERREND